MRYVLAKFQRQKWALLSLLVLILGACGKPYQPANTNRDTGYELPVGEREDPVYDPTYKPNPKFEEYVKKSREKELPQSQVSGERPTDIIFDEVEEPAMTPSHPISSDADTSAPLTEELPRTDETITVVAPMPPSTAPKPVPSHTPSTPPATTPQKPSQPAQKPGTPPVAPKQPPTFTPPKVATPAAPAPVPTARKNCQGKLLQLTPDGQAWCFYSNGRLYNGVQLPAAGKGFYAQASSRQNQWMAREALEAIMFSTSEYYDSFNKNVLIGSASQKNGGVIINRSTGRAAHLSHQNGLDVDIKLPRHNEELEQDLVSGGRATRNFDVTKAYYLMNLFVSTNRVRKILVNPAIKRALCEYSKTNVGNYDPLQTKIATWPGHENHMHVRFKCPEGSEGYCVEQADYTEGTECPNGVNKSTALKT